MLLFMGRCVTDIMIMLILCSITISISAKASDEDVSDLRDSTLAFDDPLMTSYDLAFYLATHGYNAVPEDGCVVLVLEGSTYNLIPNGEKPGLCDILLKASN